MLEVDVHRGGVVRGGVGPLVKRLAEQVVMAHRRLGGGAVRARGQPRIREHARERAQDARLRSRAVHVHRGVLHRGECRAK